MGLEGKVNGLALINRSLNLKEKAYFWIAQLNACMLPISAGYSMVEWKLPVTNLVLAVGGLVLMQHSYNHRKGKGAMGVQYKPSTAVFSSRRHQ